MIKLKVLRCNKFFILIRLTLWCAMNTIEHVDFKNKKPNFGRLIDYGFILGDQCYEYECTLKSSGFHLKITISLSGVVHTMLTDLDAGEEYTLHLNPTSTGEFVGLVRQEYNQILSDIIEKCFDNNVFKSELANKIIEYVNVEYSIEFEYLWAKFPNNAIVRRLDNQKWFAALLTVERSKIGVSGEGIIEIIDLKMRPEDKEKIIDNDKYLPGYHMNKNHWFTICLDGRVSFEEIVDKLNASYHLAK